MVRVVFLFVISVTAVMAAIPIRIESITCIGNELYCSNLSCSVEVIRQKMQVLNFDCTFTEEMDSLIMKFTLYKKMGATYRNFVIDSTENLCKVFDKTERSNVISRMMPMWKNFGRFSKSCPVKGYVSVRRYPMDLSFYPTILPRGDFKIVLKMIEAKNNTSVLNVTLLFNVNYA